MDKLLLTPEEAAEQLGIGRTKIFELLKSGMLLSVKIDGCRRVPASAIHSYVENLLTTAIADL